MLLFSVNIYSQEINTKAIYKDHFNSGIGLISSTYEMIFTNRESLYVDRTSDKEKIYEKSNDVNSAYSPKLIGDTHPQFYYRNRLKNKIIFNQTTLRKEYTIFEEGELMKWNLINETKIIGKFTCYKATTEFRGREYTAWYTLEIPVPFGPRKFGGLPGLIISISDNSNKFSSRLVEILQYKKAHQESIFTSYSDMSVISYDSFKQSFCEDSKKFEKILISKMPRGNTLVSSSIGLGSDENLEIFEFTCDN